MPILRRASVVIVLCVLTAGASDRKGSETLAADIEKLNSKDPRTRSAAAMRLTAAGATALPFLQEVLCAREEPKRALARAEAARIAGELKAEALADCLTRSLLDGSWLIRHAVMESDQTLLKEDPAFAALVKIGTPAIPGIRKAVFHLRADQALAALRALRLINTSEAREAAQAYVDFLENQTSLAREITAEFGAKAN